MAVVTSYPGVYVQEVSSGVRTIAGVSTSVTAFVGEAKRGPVNTPTTVFSFTEFERTFGGQTDGMRLAFAVQQFFLNGGSEAIIVRIADSPSPAAIQLKRINTATLGLTVTARFDGEWGRDLRVQVDLSPNQPDSYFDLTIFYAPDGNRDQQIVERFEMLSMNSADPRYVETIVNGASAYVTVARTGALPATKGTSASRPIVASDGTTLLKMSTLIDDTHNQFRISCNGLAPITVQFGTGEIAPDTAANELASFVSKLAAKIIAAANGNAAYLSSTVAVDAVKGFKITSGVGGEFSTVRILPGAQNDLSRHLNAGAANKGVEVDAVATIRPRPTPDSGSVTSDALGVLAFTTQHLLKVSIDGYGPDEIDLGTPSTTKATLAGQIRDRIRDKRPSVAAYRDFNATYDTVSDKLTLTSGTRGAGSSVVIHKIGTDTLSDLIKVTAGAFTTVVGSDTALQGGNAGPVTAANEYNNYIPSGGRKGILALESVDIFNLMVLPGVTNGSILAEAAAYCEMRRAFLIIDSPSSLTPSEMKEYILGPDLTKSKNSAVFYPWVGMPNPVKGGKIEIMPPSGAIAGLFARTDGTRGIWKAPAGTDATVIGAKSVEYALTDNENGLLNPRGVNCIRSFPTYGIINWGGRTLRGDDQMADEWKYIPVRRVALYIEESLFRGLKWVVFEPNDEPLWAQIRLNVGSFMHGLFRQGAFQGSSPKEAYFVKCDRETTTQNDINLGIVNIIVGFAPLKPAEFVVLSIQQMAGQIQV